MKNACPYTYLSFYLFTFCFFTFASATHRERGTNGQTRMRKKPMTSEAKITFFPETSAILLVGPRIRCLM